MTQPAAFVERRHIRSGIAIRLGFGLLVAWLGWAWISPSAANATPGPARTPPAFTGHGLGPSAAGLQPRAAAEVQGLLCYDLAICLLPSGSLYLEQQTTTASDGSFHLRFFSDVRINVFRTEIDGIEMRAVVDCPTTDIVISPISEATAQLLAARMVQSYGACGIATTEAKVANANHDTYFSGLSVADAHAHAHAHANADTDLTQPRCKDSCRTLPLPGESQKAKRKR